MEMPTLSETDHSGREKPIIAYAKNTVIIGMGEVGSAHFDILSDHYPVWSKDINSEKTNLANAPSQFHIVLICFPYGDNYVDKVLNYIHEYKPSYVNILTTVPPGTTDEIQELYPDARFCHSTTRGLHPNLKEGLKAIMKHAGGASASFFGDYYRTAGIRTATHHKAITTEVLHILNNCHYGVNLMFADEAAKLCREYGVDYFDWMKYGATNNIGFIDLGHETKVRPVLTPPGGKIGGHCVVHSANLIPQSKRPPLLNRLSRYNDKNQSLYITPTSTFKDLFSSITSSLPFSDKTKKD